MLCEYNIRCRKGLYVISATFNANLAIKIFCPEQSTVMLWYRRKSENHLSNLQGNGVCGRAYANWESDHDPKLIDASERAEDASTINRRSTKLANRARDDR